MNEKRLSLRRSLFVMLAFLLLGGAAAMATTPAVPVRLRASYVPDGQIVHLYWFNGDSLHPVGGSYNVYQAEASDSARNHFTFTKVATVPDSNGMGSYTTSLPVGVYSFFVTATDGNQESAPSSPVSIRVYAQVLSFTAPYPLTDSVLAGTDYTFQVKAVSSRPGDVITYRLSNAMVGMTISGTTGSVYWHPYKAGTYDIWFVAFLANDPDVKIESHLTLTVLPNPAQNCATFYGEVRYSQTNELVPSGTVYAIPSDSGGGQPTASVHFTDGHYNFTAPPGSYRVMVQGNTFATANYDFGGGALYDSVMCGDSLHADFSVVKRVVAGRDSITGRVRRAIDGMPSTAVVHFASQDSSGSHEYSVNTDSNGYYSFVAPISGPFIAHAVPLNGDLLDQYFDHVATEGQATPIRASAGNATANFDLEPSVVYNNSLAGTLISKRQQLLAGQITAYSISNGHATFVRTADAPNGSFSFTNLTPGTYVLYATAYDSSNVPGYYRENHKAERSWQDATQLTITSTSATAGIEIKLDEENGHHGSNHLRGEIGEDGGRAKHDIVSLQGSKPLAGATVFAIDDQGTVSGYAVTDAAGAFLIDGLVDGVYTVQVDKIGFTGALQTVTLGANPTDVTIGLTRVDAASGVPTAGIAGASIAALPNPAGAEVTLSFTAAAGSARLTLVNAAGRQVLARTIETVDGANAIHLRTEELGAGIYFVKIQGEKINISRSLTIVH